MLGIVLVSGSIVYNGFTAALETKTKRQVTCGEVVK